MTADAYPRLLFLVHAVQGECARRYAERLVEVRCQAFSPRRKTLPAHPEMLIEYGFEISVETGTLHVRWSDAGRFYGNFHSLLLGSGVHIFEVQSTASLLEKAIDPSVLT